MSGAISPIFAGSKPEWLALYFTNGKEPTKPGDDVKGCALVRAHDVVEAVRETHRLGINPGGGVRAYAVPELDVTPPDPAWLGRLLTYDEMGALLEKVRVAA